MGGKKRCERNACSWRYLAQTNVEMFKAGKVREIEDNRGELFWYSKGQRFKSLFKALEEGNKDGYIGDWKGWPFERDLEGDNEVGESWGWVEVVPEERGQDLLEGFNSPPVVEFAKTRLEGDPEFI